MRNKCPQIKFGTDGWRGIIGEEYTFANVRIVSQAVADYLGSGKRVVVGFDTRFSSDRFAKTSAQVLSHNGIEVTLADSFVSTPMLSFAVKSGKFDLGVMITASHNPAEYNGFKIKDRTGGSASPQITGKIEGLLGRSAVKDANPRTTRVKTADLSSGYVRFIRSYVDLKRIRNIKFKVLVDAMYGAGDGFMAKILKGTDIRVAFLHDEMNPSFAGIKPEPVEENLGELSQRVKKEKFDLGIALDGDADRIAALAPRGIFIHPQKILGLLALHLHQDKGWSGAIVKTIAGTTMIDHIARYLKIKLYETPVGFKYISNLMERENILCGGEEAGGMGVKGYIPERDGIMAGLLLLEMMAFRGKDILSILNETEKQFGRYYYLRDEIRLKRSLVLAGRKFPLRLLGKKILEKKDYDGVKLICEDESWLMLRASGTEPIVRIYAESKGFHQSSALIQLGKSLVKGWLKD
jgi:phosphomannomutase